MPRYSYRVNGAYTVHVHAVSKADADAYCGTHHRPRVYLGQDFPRADYDLGAVTDARRERNRQDMRRTDPGLYDAIYGPVEVPA